MLSAYGPTSSTRDPGRIGSAPSFFSSTGHRTAAARASARDLGRRNAALGSDGDLRVVEQPAGELEAQHAPDGVVDAGRVDIPLRDRGSAGGVDDVATHLDIESGRERERDRLVLGTGDSVGNELDDAVGIPDDQPEVTPLVFEDLGEVATVRVHGAPGDGVERGHHARGSRLDGDAEGLEAPLRSRNSLASTEL